MGAETFMQMLNREISAFSELTKWFVKLIWVWKILCNNPQTLRQYDCIYKLLQVEGKEVLAKLGIINKWLLLTE